MLEHLEEIAQRHIARSLDEMRDPHKCDRWANGERAKEQASEIVTLLIEAACQRLEQGEIVQ